MFAAFLMLALLVPAVLLVLVRVLAWALPPPYRWAVRFTQRYPVALSVLEAALWVLLLTRSLGWSARSTTDWLLASLWLLFAIDAIVRAVRRSRGQDDFVTTWVRKRYPEI
jgi:hypothetical protein